MNRIKSYLKFLTVLFLFLLTIIYFMSSMPGESRSDYIAAKDPQLANSLRNHIKILSQDCYPRNLYTLEKLNAAKDYLIAEFTASAYQVKQQKFTVEGKEVANLDFYKESETGKPWLIIGAHYDSAYDTPGANDNASGIAALIEIAKSLKDLSSRYEVHFLAFVNEEPPFFWTEEMGSQVYAQSLKKDKVLIAAMFSLETIGYYSEESGSQKYPPLFNIFYPDKGNFIAFVGNLYSRALTQHSVRSFRELNLFPSEGVAAPSKIPGIGWSDHYSFWQIDVPAVMITDTAPFRYPYYHTKSDTIDKIDFQRLSSLTAALSIFFRDFHFPT